MDKLRKVTLCYLISEDKVLLAMKKRGFGEGKWNGVGGKVREGESILSAMKREAKEEIGVEVKSLKKVGEIYFYFPHKREWDEVCYIYITGKWEGEILESEEMRPVWFDKDKLPYKEMWSSDLKWLDKVLKGEKVKAKCVFTPELEVLEFEFLGS